MRALRTHTANQKINKIMKVNGKQISLDRRMTLFGDRMLDVGGSKSGAGLTIVSMPAERKAIEKRIRLPFPMAVNVMIVTALVSRGRNPNRFKTDFKSEKGVLITRRLILKGRAVA